jgi:hypothetical protein
MGYGTPIIPKVISTRGALAKLLAELGYVFIDKNGGYADLERLPSDAESWGGRLNGIEAHEKQTHQFAVETRNEFELHRVDKHGANACHFCGRIDPDKKEEEDEPEK